MEESSFGRLAGVLISPVRTFESIRERPTWIAPLVVLVVLAAGVSLIASPKVDWEDVLTTQMEKSGREVSAEQVEGMVEFYETWGLAVSAGTTGIGYPIGFLLFAGAFFVAFKVLGSDLTYKQSLATVLHGFMPFAVSLLLSLPIVLTAGEIGAEEIKSGSFLVSSLAAFAPEGASPVTLAVLSSLDFFSLWTVILLGIGFSVVAGVGRGMAFGVTLVFWAIWIGFKVVGALIQGAFGG
ncbi:MAG: YIP1 family protein [Thermoanaerobaculia bacterium]|nr:YIP1 family protein [Thermoanaerobaculia bacterium]